MAKILTAFDKSDSKEGDSGVTVETWAKLGPKTLTQKLAPKFDPCNFHPCISTPLPIRVKHHASLVYSHPDPLLKLRLRTRQLKTQFYAVGFATHFSKCRRTWAVIGCR